ncbi:type II toxin-antitoxin system MqsA family antitoxin [Paraburkholderia tropica]|uniref:type II toxin-antitoxin system MqsA family antitoxin n=1 Tax=Paraburkholderia tropica TaxID=92647 RepID=UPI002AB7D3FF|nr:type II toxin-antitoxin system MqsA family antitoxin [Paraburkholderia tropica]
MTLNRSCQSCGKDQTSVESYTDTIEYKGIPVTADGLLRTICLACGYEFTTDEQHDHNVFSVKSAFLEQRTEAKRKLGRLTGQQIRAIRLELGLTQQEAAELFGGGVNAFSRYEKEEVVQPASMDRLIRLAAHLGKDGLDLVRESAATSEVRQASPKYKKLSEVTSASITVSVEATCAFGANFAENVFQIDPTMQGGVPRSYDAAAIRPTHH